MGGFSLSVASTTDVKEFVAVKKADLKPERVGPPHGWPYLKQTKKIVIVILGVTFVLVVEEYIE